MDFMKIISSNIFLYNVTDESAKSYIKSPFSSQSILNIQNDDNYCFLYSILAYFYYETEKTHRYRSSIYKKYIDFKNQTAKLPKEKTLNFKDIKFPFKYEDVPKFEKLNQFLSVNVFGIKEFTEDEIEPITKMSKEEKEHNIDLLLLTNETNSHYILITKLANLLKNKKHKNHRFVCRNCLNLFVTEEAKNNHSNQCKNNSSQRIKLPENKDYEFNKHYMKSKIPFLMEFDFESTLIKLPTCRPSEKNSFEHKTEKHIANSFYINLHSEHKNIIKSQSFSFISRDSDKVLNEFMKVINDLSLRFNKIFKINEQMIISEEEENQFQSTNNCMYCNKVFEDDKVRDHCHFTGKYRGASCYICNLEEGKNRKFVPIYCHNLSGYDANLIIETLAKNQNQYQRLKPLANSEEKYISFQFGKLRFLDSYKFFLKSLDDVSKSMKDEDFILTRKEFPEDEKFNLLRKKGIYPYEYIDDYSKFNEIQLPSKESFYSKLRQEGISDKDYSHAQKVWETFKCEKLEDYHMLYLKSDVLLLHDCIMNFRDVIYKNYGIDMCYHYTTPGLTWDCGFKYTKKKIELLQDVDMLLMFENMIRGGFSGTLGERHIKANNKYLPEYDNTKKSNYIMYFDENNLYGWSMSQPLPTGNFKWKNEEYYKSGKPCIVEVDLEYPKDIQMKTRKYPLMPYNRSIGIDELSEYQNQILSKLNEKNPKDQKLILDLHDKNKYIVYYKTLKFYETMGIKIKKIHRTISFDEEAWLKKYIDNNTENRKRATCDFEKDIWKLLNNSFYGKTVENQRNRMSVKFSNEEKETKRLISKTNFTSCKIFNDYVLIRRKNKTVYLNKPIYLGACILDLSKLLMYEFYYNIINKQWPLNELIYSDSVN